MDTFFTSSPKSPLTIPGIIRQSICPTMSRGLEGDHTTLTAQNCLRSRYQTYVMWAGSNIRSSKSAIVLEAENL